jgi:hypothetical protein
MQVEMEQRSRLAERRVEAEKWRDPVKAIVKAREDAGVLDEVRRSEDLLHLGAIDLLEDEVRAVEVVDDRDGIAEASDVPKQLGLFRGGPPIPVPAEDATVAQIEHVGVAAARDEAHDRH